MHRVEAVGARTEVFVVSKLAKTEYVNKMAQIAWLRVHARCSPQNRRVITFSSEQQGGGHNSRKMTKIGIDTHGLLLSSV